MKSARFLRLKLLFPLCLVVATTFSDASMLDFPGSVAGTTQVVGTSADGSISVGTYDLAVNQFITSQLGFVYQNGVYSTVNPYNIDPLLVMVNITSVNAAGDYVGWEQNTLTSHFCCFVSYGFSSIPWPPDHSGYCCGFFSSIINSEGQIERFMTEPLVINNRDQIEGMFFCGEDTDCNTRVAPINSGDFLIIGDNMYLNYSGPSGQVTQFYQQSDGYYNLISEPPAWSMMLSMFPALIFFFHRRRQALPGRRA